MQKKQREDKAKAAKVKDKKKRDKKDKHALHKSANLGACRVMADSFTGLRVGTDFSGWDTPIMSLRALSIRHLHVFSCEKEPHLRRLIRQNSNPLKVYKDVVSRSPGMSLPCDLYVAGPPCQPWSSAGKGGGLSDEAGCGGLLWSSLAYIGMERPKVAVIENVKGLLLKHRRMFEKFVADFKGKGYTVFWEVMNTMSHGLPQNRPRIYFVGFRSDLHVADFEFPSPLKAHVPIERILRPGNFGPEFTPKSHSNAKSRIREARRALKSKGVDVEATPVFVDVAASKRFAVVAVGYCPCITYSRGSQGGYYVTNLKRKLTLEDRAACTALAPQGLAWLAPSRSQQGRLEVRPPTDPHNKVKLPVRRCRSCRGSG